MSKQLSRKRVGLSQLCRRNEVQSCAGFSVFPVDMMSLQLCESISQQHFRWKGQIRLKAHWVVSETSSSFTRGYVDDPNIFFSGPISFVPSPCPVSCPIDRFHITRIVSNHIVFSAENPIGSGSSEKQDRSSQRYSITNLIEGC